MPGSPSTWSAWKWVMNTSSSSTRPTERTSWRWVPSPQSNSSLSPPRVTSVAGRPRRAVGADPAVPRNNTSRFMAGPILKARSVECDELELEAPRLGPRQAHRAEPSPASFGGTPGVEDLEAVTLLVEGHVRVAEHHGVGVREAPPEPLEPPTGRSRVM